MFEIETAISLSPTSGLSVSWFTIVKKKWEKLFAHVTADGRLASW
jgi:hypothetical protein